MVSHKLFELTTRVVLWIAVLAAAGALGQPGLAEERGNNRKFYADDPLLREPAPVPTSGIATRSIDHLYDFLDSAYVTPRREGKIAKHEGRPALDVNTVGEIPDNAWYTNRHHVRRMSIEELQRGPGNRTPPDSDRPWRITSAKSDGITPGFVIEDSRKNRYVLKFDPPEYPELCSAADVIGSKLFYALGYNTPENYIVHFRREQLEISDGVKYRHPSGKKFPLTAQIVDRLLQAQPKSSDGTYRALASRWLEGKVIGQFDYRGARSDDPNDTIPHEQRRVLRGLAVFASWVNHHDTSQINTMDTLATEDGRPHVKHYLIDFGSILGSRGDRAKEPWIGHQHAITHAEAAIRAATLGLYIPNWQRSDYPKLRGAGLIDSWSFDPLQWKPEAPNPAFLMMDDGDAFWAAKQVATFTDDEIRAIVATGNYSDQRTADWISDCLIKRRDKIAQAWFSEVLALDRFRAADGRLAFDDLSAGHTTGAPRSYEVNWATYDNDRGVLTPLANSSGTTIPQAPSPAEYRAATIRCAGAPAEPGPGPVTVYLRRSETGFQVVGIDR
jgi:hypothetical protein